MSTLSRFLCTLALIGGPASATRACDACAVYVAEGAGRSGFALAVAQQSTYLGTVWDGAKAVHDPERQFLHGSVTQVALSYGRGGWWSAQATLPYLHRTFRRIGEEGVERGHLSGIGDAILSFRGELWRKEGRAGSFAFAVLGGIKFSTGDSDRLGAELSDEHGPGAALADEHGHETMPGAEEHAGAVHDHDLALGSGSTDYLLGADAAWHRRRLFVRAGLQSKLRRPGAFGYRYADETTWEIGPGGFAILTDRRSLAVQGLFSVERKGLDTLGGRSEDDTGFSTWFAGGRLTATAGEQFRAEASLEVPVRRRTSGVTVAPNYRLRAAVTWRF